MREVFNSDNLKSNEIEAEAGNKNDVFAYEQRLIFTGDLGKNPRNKHIVGEDGTTYIVKGLRYSDSRGSVYDLMKSWA